ncbi:uncharacterized protein BO66DRAFT_471962 [Aspergillus aculeatinus CBS 121060]|uniref:Uncharacterized protein n=1 Tax=Aspergillus aculeatinus CBS 121060 TaxID=1448322 RepID=A0ACD1H7B2_9EURO|nr:hypothetical protein BO66DRAFT_471962 [Aspergillus aculeatinus CBS 121060]RAH69441.1 hypothetical protein BO66DRAFT_471962 [Aspergillus aculeatinus CBS 121060]
MSANWLLLQQPALPVPNSCVYGSILLLPRSLPAFARRTPLASPGAHAGLIARGVLRQFAVSPANWLPCLRRLLSPRAGIGSVDAPAFGSVGRLVTGGRRLACGPCCELAGVAGAVRALPGTRRAPGGRSMSASPEDPASEPASGINATTGAVDSR